MTPSLEIKAVLRKVAPDKFVVEDKEGEAQRTSTDWSPGPLAPTHPVETVAKEVNVL